MSRRLALILGVFLAVVFIISATGIGFAPFILVALGISAALAYLRYKNKFFILMFAAGVCAFLFCAAHYNLIEKPVLNYIGETVAVRAEVRSVRQGAFFTRFDLRVVETDGQRLNRFARFNINLTVYDVINAEIGDIFEAYISFTGLGGEDYRFYKPRGIFIAADIADEYDEEVRIMRVSSRGVSYHINRLQVRVREVFFRHIRANFHDRPTQEASVTYGIFTGITHELSPRVRNYFRRTGVAHVLSVSGLHLSILAGICAYVLRTLSINKKISSILVILFSLSFAAFAGFTMSATRAAVMIILFYSAFLLERKSDSLTSLLIAGFLIVLPNPYHSVNLGFQLSFCATFGIIFTQDLSYKITEKLKFKALKIMVSSVFITLAAVVFTLPVTAYNFGAISLVSVLTNLIISPFVYFILFFALMLSLFSFMNISVILAFFGWLLYHGVRLLINIVRFISSFEYAYISVQSTVNTYFHLFSIIFLSACILLILFFKREKMRKYLYIFASLSFILLLASQIYPRILFNDSVRFAYFSDYRNQNIILFHRDYNSADIIDITHGTAAPVWATYNILKANGAVNINSIVLTHYHWRHVRMIDRYANHSSINRVYVPEILSDSDAHVYNLLYNLSQSLDFTLVSYQNALRLGDVLISRGIFEYNRMTHFLVDMNYGAVNLLYLGIGYYAGFRAYAPQIFNVDYDIVFYGTHKHNFRDDDWVAEIYASFAGVLSQYLSRSREHASYRFRREILDKYLERGHLFYPSGDSYSHIVFTADRSGGLTKRFMR